jgi:hypothetical protein
MTRRTSDTWQPDLFNGVGIQRSEGLTRADELEQARQEMRDTGSADLFDVLASAPIETERVYGVEMPVRYYANHCTACNRRWTVRIASVGEVADQEWDHCTACYTGPFAFYSED